MVTRVEYRALYNMHSKKLYLPMYTRSVKVHISSYMYDITDVICTLLLCKLVPFTILQLITFRDALNELLPSKDPRTSEMVSAQIHVNWTLKFITRRNKLHQNMML